MSGHGIPGIIARNPRPLEDSLTPTTLLLAIALVSCGLPLRTGPAEGCPEGSERPCLTVAPATALVDEPVRVTAGGIPAGAEATISATLTIEPDLRFRSEAVVRAGADGVVDATRDSSAGGTYTGVDAMGLFWSMRPVEPGAPGPAPPACAPPGPCSMALELIVGGETVARATAVRTFLSPGVRALEVREDGVVGTLYLPPGEGRPPVVIVLSGSEGGIPEVRAALLASHGFAALALAYFRAEGLPDELFEVPIETVERGIAWLASRDGVAAGRIALLGGSKGAELALLAASRLPEVAAVVAYAPTAYAWPGITRTGGSRDTSSWTWRGEPVPYVPHAASPEFEAQFQRPPPFRLRLLYEASVADTLAASRGAIEVENIHGPLLLIAGDDDQMGPSCENADVIARRLERHGLGDRATVLCYEDAGHAIGFPYVPTTRVMAGPFALGGDPAAYARADADSWPRVLAFLRGALAADPE